jgi:hypothetical protein
MARNYVAEVPETGEFDRDGLFHKRNLQLQRKIPNNYLNEKNHVFVLVLNLQIIWHLTIKWQFKYEAFFELQVSHVVLISNV